MTTPASQVQLTIVEDVLGELILLDAPATQVVVGTDLSDTEPLPIGTAAAGTSIDGARADHVHAHGNQLGGSLHAAATTSAAGFMSGTDKTKIDNATASGTANTLVLRDSFGNFAANVISADLIGNVTGDLTGAASAIADNTVTSAKIVDGTIVNADISPTANIAVSKLAPGINPRQLLQTNAAGDGVEWTDNLVVLGNLTVQGDLTVNGTETIINTQTLTVEDKNIELGKITSPTDVTADGGGITLKGDTDKTINWIDATDAWTLSEHVDLATGKEYRINGAKVLDATSLGTSVLITSANITDGTIVNADINASAAIAGTKISPNFGSQNVVTTGTSGATTLLVGTTVTPTGVSSGAMVAQTRTVIGPTGAGSNQVYAGEIGSITATTGTVVFKFKTTQTGSARACFARLAISNRSGTNTVSQHAAAEYAFQLHQTSATVCTLNGATSIFEFTYVRATHFAFADLGGGECTVTLTNPVAAALTGAYRVELVSPAGFWTLDSVTTT
jgi:hypothetical protein